MCKNNDRTNKIDELNKLERELANTLHSAIFAAAELNMTLENDDATLIFQHMCLELALSEARTLHAHLRSSVATLDAHRQPAAAMRQK